jgi:hypothetical protein
MTTSNSPTITLVFKGLFLFAFEKDRRFCQAGIIAVERHHLKINIQTRRHSHLSGSERSVEVPDGNLSFHVTGRANGIQTYEPGLFERNSSHDQRDFRWALDLEGNELHNRRLPVKADSIDRSFFITDGKLYTYYSQDVTIVDPCSQTRNVAIAQEIGCDIHLDDNQEAVLRYGHDGGNSMKFRKEPDINYHIVVENICSREGVPRLDIGDFAYYYNVVDVPAAQQFQVNPFSPPPRDDSNPCNPVYLGKSSAPLPISSGFSWFLELLALLKVG